MRVSVFAKIFFSTVEIERWGGAMPGHKDWTGQRFGRLPSLLWGESITTPFGFLGAIAVQSTGASISNLLAKTTPFVRVDVCIVRLPASTSERTVMRVYERGPDGAALSFTCCAKLEGVPNAWRTRRRARRQEEWQLPPRRQDEGNDRGLEAHKITALTSAWRNSGSAKTRSCVSITMRQGNET